MSLLELSLRATHTLSPLWVSLSICKAMKIWTQCTSLHFQFPNWYCGQTGWHNLISFSLLNSCCSNCSQSWNIWPRDLSARIDAACNGTPLQYSCLENPMDGGAWKAAVPGVAKSRTRLHFHFHFLLSCIGEGNGNPLQCSCLENPRDRGAWWAAVYGVAQSRTWLKRLSSSSRSIFRAKTEVMSLAVIIGQDFHLLL